MNKKQGNLRDSILIDVSESFSFNFLLPGTKHTPFWIKKPSLILSPIEKEDLKLLTTLIQGDENSFIKMIDRYHSAILGFSRTLSMEKIEVERVVMDTWEVVLQRIHQFERQYSLKIWIFEILIERVRSHFSPSPNLFGFRRVASNVESTFPKPSGKKESNKSGYSSFFGSSNSCDQDQNRIPTKKVIPQDLFEKMKAALYQLPLKEKQVMYLRDVERFTSDEVFHLLQIDGPHQGQLLHKARETMRKVLDGALASSEPLSSASHHCPDSPL